MSDDQPLLSSALAGVSCELLDQHDGFGLVVLVLVVSASEAAIPWCSVSLIGGLNHTELL